MQAELIPPKGLYFIFWPGLWEYRNVYSRNYFILGNIKAN